MLNILKFKRLRSKKLRLYPEFWFEITVRFNKLLIEICKLIACDNFTTHKPKNPLKLLERDAAYRPRGRPLSPDHIS